MRDRNLFNWKKDWKVLIVLVAVAVAFYWIGTPLSRKAPMAVITVDGVEVSRIMLHSASDETFSLADTAGVPVSFQIQEHRIRFVDVTCPDHICERTGFIDKPGESAVCMPNKTILAIRAPDDLD